MRILKIVLGLLLGFGLLFGGIPTLISDISDGVEGAVILGEIVALFLFLAATIYLFYTASNNPKP